MKRVLGVLGGILLLGVTLPGVGGQRDLARAQDTQAVRGLTGDQQRQLFGILTKISDLREENEALLARVDALEKRVATLEVKPPPVVQLQQGQ